MEEQRINPVYIYCQRLLTEVVYRIASDNIYLAARNAICEQ